MYNLKCIVHSLLISIVVCGLTRAALVKPNPIISRGTKVTVEASSGDVTGINDNKFGQYDKKQWTISDNSWIALKLASGPSKIFITFNCPDTSWSDSIGLAADSCKKTVQYPVDYDILTSANSTTGADGDWASAVSIKGNSVTGRGHLVDFTGASWVKMAISKGKGTIDEIEVFDATNGAEDTWFFLGTKITALMFKGGKASGYPTDKSPPDSTFASMVQLRNPTFSPAVIRGGINCGVKTGDVVRDISKYLAVAGNVHFWAIEIGTWDAWGGGNTNVASFKNNLKIIIDSCRAHQIQPIIARVAATDTIRQKSLWQVHADFRKAVDSLTEANTLIPGVDFFAYLTNAAIYGNLDLDEKGGILPNDYGNFELQREWAKKMDTVVYKKTVDIFSPRPAIDPTARLILLSRNGRLVLDVDCPGTATLFTFSGRILEEAIISAAGRRTLMSVPGCCIVRFTSMKGVETIRAVNY
ncbi:MAG: hypothetical protein JXA18_11645 [Chitinispirillaceae bacterium]|nr:hypothetical protein [Chitinispirillaceae bacterium]